MGKLSTPTNHFLYLPGKNGYNRKSDTLWTFGEWAGRFAAEGMILKKGKMLIAFFCVLALAGCGAISPEGKARSGGNNFDSMEETPDLSYEVPVSTPGILVNQLGYMTSSAKIAVFKGKEIPEVFYVIDAESGDTVYTGSLEKKGYDSERGEYNSYGDFSQLQREGNYYIEAPVLGKSYTFSIGTQVYDEVFREACRQYYYNRCGMTLTSEYAGENAHNACHTGKAYLKEDTSISLDVTGGWHQDEKGQKDVTQAAQAMSMMLLSYELYEDIFTDDMGIPESGNGIPDILDEIKYEVEWLLKMQNQQTGAVYAGVSIYAPNTDAPGKAADIYVEPESAEAERAFAMALAKFSYLYQDFDNEYATRCLKAADRAWKHAELHKEDEAAEEKWKFAAAAELYRAAGKSSYHKYIKEYLAGEEWQEQQDEVILLGSVTYISTKQTVEIELCEKIMEMLMSRAEEISKQAGAGVYLTAEDEEQENNNQMLLEMMYLTVVNHVITNHEYETVIENHLHYLMGRNEKAVSYIDKVGTKNSEAAEESAGAAPGIMKQFDADSKLILMLSEIMDSGDR